jgi:hypothetical protein
MAEAVRYQKRQACGKITASAVLAKTRVDRLGAPCDNPRMRKGPPALAALVACVCVMVGPASLAVILPQACRFWYRTASAIYDDGKH